MVKYRKAANVLNLVVMTAGAVSGAMGMVVLLGSYTHSTALLRVLQSFVPMHYNAALAFILCGTGLLSIAFGRARLAITAGIAAGIGLFVLYFGFDRFRPELFRETEFVLSETPMALGLLMALLFALALHFAQTASLRAQEAELINRELERQIAERKQAQEALKTSQDYARSIIDSSLDMIVAVDEDRRIIEFNKAAQEAFGYRPEEVLGKHVNMLYADIQEGAVVHQTTLRNSRGLQEILNKRKNGEVFPSFLSASILRNAKGARIGVMGISRDITERKRAKERDQRNMRRLRALHDIEMALSSTLDAGTVSDLLLEKIDVVLGYSAATIRLVNRETGQLEPIACRNLDEQEWKRDSWRNGRGLANMVLNNKAPVMIGDVQSSPQTRDNEFFRKHGLVSYLGVPLVAKGQILGVLGFYTKEPHQFDNEEIQFLTTVSGQAATAIQNCQLYDEMVVLATDLARANRAKDEFLSVMSHELRTPLNVVLGYSSMIVDRLLGEINEEQEKALVKVITRAKDQLAMISSILEVSKMEAERVKVHSHEFSLGELLDDLRSSYQIPFGKEVTITWDYSSELPVMKTDSEKLRHILENLINNAIKFTGKGSVTVSAHVTEGSRQKAERSLEILPTANGQLPTGGKYVEFKVADTGIGIPEEALPLIFEKFRQLDSSETRTHGGVGVGLYIVKKYSEMLGAKVSVQSTPGKGTTFSVVLPLGARISQQQLKAA